MKKPALMMVLWLALQALAWGQAPAHVVVISSTQIPDEERAAALTEGPETFAERYQRRGYQGIAQGEVRYLFDPSLWASDYVEGLPKVYEELLTAARDGSLVDLSKATTLGDYLQHLLGRGSSLANVGEAAWAPTAGLWIELESGSRKLSIDLINRSSPETRKRLEDRPLRRREPGTPAPVPPAAPAPERSFAPPIVRQLHIAVSGPRSLEPGYRAWLAAEATRALSERLQAAATRLRELERSLAESPLAAEFAAVANARTMQDLPAELRQRLESTFVGSYRRLGFASEADAQAFFSAASVSRHRLLMNLEAVQTSGGRTSGVIGGLPLP